MPHCQIAEIFFTALIGTLTVALLDGLDDQFIGCRTRAAHLDSSQQLSTVRTILSSRVARCDGDDDGCAGEQACHGVTIADQPGYPASMPQPSPNST